jgi:hypothetical protein
MSDSEHLCLSAPLWFSFSQSHYAESLTKLTRSELEKGVHRFKKSGHKSKEHLISDIVNHFEMLRTQFVNSSESSLLSLDVFSSYTGPTASHILAYMFISNSLSESITTALMIPPCSVFDRSVPLEIKLNIPRGASSSYSKPVLKSVLRQLHPSRQPGKNVTSFQDLSAFLVNSVYDRIYSFYALCKSDILNHIRCMDPYFEEWEFDRQELIIEFLVFEYGEAIIEFLLTDTIFRGRLKRYRDKIAESEELFEADNNFWTQIENQWPQTPNLQTTSFIRFHIIIV